MTALRNLTLKEELGEEELAEMLKKPDFVAKSIEAFGAAISSGKLAELYKQSLNSSVGLFNALPLLYPAR